MLRIYLDQQHWINLARAEHDDEGSSDYREALELVRGAVRLRIASFPLSSNHYIELHNIKKRASRSRLARVMAEISLFDTIAPARALLPGEIDRALQRWFGRPLVARESPAFGHGISHAFHEDLIGFELPQNPIVSIDRPEALQAHLNAQLELLLLAGPPEDLEDGMRETSYRRVAINFASEQQQFVEAMKNWSAAERRNAAAAREYFDLIDPLNDAFERVGIPAGRIRALGPEGMTAFLSDIPTRDVAHQLHRVHYQDLNRPWKKGHMNDIAALTVAVPYCDIVVTEKSWRDNIERAGLDEKYSTRVVSTLREIVPDLLLGELKLTA